MAHDGRSIQETTASTYVNGVKPLPKDLIYDLLHLPAEEVIRRFKELGFFDVRVIAARLIRLLEHTSITDAAKKELLMIANAPDMEFRFLCEMFWASLKNSANTARLSKAEKAIIKACRDNTPIPDNFIQPEPSVVGVPSSEEEAAEQSAPTSFDDSLQEQERPASHHTEYFPGIGPAQNLIAVFKWEANTAEAVQKASDYFNTILCDSGDTVINLDEADVAEVLRAGSSSHCFVLECSGNYSEVLHYLENCNHFRDAPSALVAIDGSTELTLVSAEDICQAVLSRMNPDAHFIFGVQISEYFEDDEIAVRVLYTVTP